MNRIMGYVALAGALFGGGVGVFLFVISDSAVHQCVAVGAAMSIGVLPYVAMRAVQTIRE